MLLKSDLEMILEHLINLDRSQTTPMETVARTQVILPIAWSNRAGALWKHRREIRSSGDKVLAMQEAVFFTFLQKSYHLGLRDTLT
jgi:hypothetical protein